MLFNSLPFILFYAVVFILFFLVPVKWRWTVLLAAGFYFYCTLVPQYLLIPLAIIFVDYFAGLQMDRQKSERGKKIYFLLALFFNLFILIFFKYYNFLSHNLNSVLSQMQMHDPIPALTWIMPLGISYYTFQSISYLIDVKNERIPAEKNMGHFALFILFFPQISAGPITRAGLLLPQFKKEQRLNVEDFSIGISQVILGYFKKVVVGDMLGNYVDTFYGSYEHHSGFAILFTSWIFLLQLYADFSGYSDIAIGLARMLGYRLQINFMLPLFSKTMTELWRRWHISFSTWLRDYLYTPIYIARRDWGKFAVVYAQIITFAICGLWHGAGWQFLVYGLIHGFYLITEFLLGIKSSFYNKNFFRKALGVFITFNLLSLSLVMFRSSSLANAASMYTNIVSHFGPLKARVYDVSFFVTMLIMIVVLLLIDYIFFRKNSFDDLYKKKPKTLFLLNLVLLTVVILFGVSSSTQFIYFKF